MASIFDKILLTGIRKGQIPARTQEAREWFRNLAKTTQTSPEKFIREDKSRLRNKAEIGRMYSFYYDPKHKKTLPYYDRFPLIFPIERYEDGFLGINLHYLPHVLRAKLMDALYALVTNQSYDEKTKLAISYNILKAASKFAAFRPCIKRYLSAHVRSRFVRIEASEWDIALWLPLESFEKASKIKVWKDSKEIIKNNAAKKKRTAPKKPPVRKKST